MGVYRIVIFPMVYYNHVSVSFKPIRVKDFTGMDRRYRFASFGLNLDTAAKIQDLITGIFKLTEKTYYFTLYRHFKQAFICLKWFGCGIFLRCCGRRSDT